jgi:hypothetical protein
MPGTERKVLKGGYNIRNSIVSTAKIVCGNEP